MVLSSILSRRVNVLSLRTAFHAVLGLTVLLSVFAFAAPRVNAQSAKNADSARVVRNGLQPIAPFVNKNTVLVVRFDLNRIDYTTLETSLKDVFSQVMKNLDFSDEYAKECEKEFALTAAALSKEAEDAIVELKAKSGLNDVYFVMQTTRGEGAAFIAPVSNITAEQQEFCKQFAESLRLNCALYQQNYMVATRAPLKEFGAYYKDFTPGANKSLESTMAQNADKLMVAACGRLKIRPLFHATLEEGPTSARVRQYDPFASSPRSIKDLVEAFDASFVEGSAYVDASTLSVHYSLKFTTSINAGKFNDGFRDVLDAYNAYYFKTFEASPVLVDFNSFSPGKSLAFLDSDFVRLYNLFGISRELTSGCSHFILPRQDEDTLVFDDSAQAEISKLGPSALAVFSVAKLIFKAGAIDIKSVEDAGTPNPFKSAD